MFVLLVSDAVVPDATVDVPPKSRGVTERDATNVTAAVATGA